MENAKHHYNRAKLYQIILFPMNNAATNFYFFFTFYIAYLAVGGYAIAVGTVGVIATFTRIFDGITDPIIGFIIDKTNSKFGKFRPMILTGYIIQAISILLMAFTFVGDKKPDTPNTIAFLLLYMLWVIGYTFQTACTKSAQTCITNDPAQRPLFTRVDGIFVMIMFSGMAMYVSNYLQPKYGKINIPAMQEFAISVIIASGVMTLLAIIALWKKDVPENWGIGENTVKVKFKDYIHIIKSNRALQMLVVAASTDKLALTAAGDAGITMVVFGIIMGNFAFLGQLSLITMVPIMIIIVLGTQFATKKGLKRTLILFTWLSIALAVISIVLYFIFDPKQFGNYDTGLIATIVFLVIYTLYKSVQSISSAIVIPMIADCSDYETYLSGRYVPGMVGTLFSFVDKLISSLSKLLVAYVLVMVGYDKVLPQQGDALTPAIFWVGMIIMYGLPIFGWVCSIIAMKFYPLSREKMIEIQAELRERKKK